MTITPGMMYQIQNAPRKLALSEVTVSRRTITDDGMGGTFEDWVDDAAPQAVILREVGYREALIAGAMQAVWTVSIVFPIGTTPPHMEDKVKFEGNVYEVQQILGGDDTYPAAVTALCGLAQ